MWRIAPGRQRKDHDVFEMLKITDVLPTLDAAHPISRIPMGPGF
jgi:hypothetical protein